MDCVNPLADPPPADRILVIRLGAVGDVVRTLPAASAIRAAYPDAELCWLVESASASLLRAQPWIDRVVEFPRAALSGALRSVRPDLLVRGLRDFLAELRGGAEPGAGVAAPFDLVVDFHGILKSGVLSRLSGAPRRVGYARPFGREGAWLFATHRARLARPRMSRFHRNDALVRFLGIAAPAAPRPLHLDPAERAAFARRLGSGPKPVALHPGTSDGTAHKRWTRAGYARLARALAADGVPTVVTCGPARDDRAFAEAVVTEAGGAARLAPPTPSLPALGALLSGCRLYVGGDTGPLHVASLVGTPVLQLLGPTDPVENAPWSGTPSRTVRVGVGCSPCRRGCAAATCMRAIRPDDVIREARSLLAGPIARW